MIMEFKLGLVLTLTLASCTAHQGYPNVRFNERRFYIQGYRDPHDRSSDDGVPGVAGRDYPIFREVPWTRFKCTRPGYYADPETGCQTYHVCQRGGRKDSFLCPNGTLFNQERLVCAWWNTVDCSRAQSFYSINEAVAKAMEEADRRITVAAEKMLSRDYQHKFRAENKPWNKYNQQDKHRGWSKDSIPIHHNQNSYLSKKFPYEVPEFIAKSFPNINTRYGNFYASRLNYKIIDAKFDKQKTKNDFARPANFYLPV